MSDPSSDTAWQELRAFARTLEPTIAERIARQWARDAQFEHASIASFGRFALELLAIGAPSELIESAHRAAIDEIEHARLCFSLASIYSDTKVGPGELLPLEVGAFVRPTLSSMAHATMIEGCVNETLAALEAQEARAFAEPRAVRDALLRIEHQESGHASLAFRFVSWAIATGGSSVRKAARDAFAIASEQIREGAQPVRAAPDPIEATLLQHGRLPDSVRAALRGRGLREVLTPAALKLFE